MGVGAARHGQVFGLRICCFGIWLLLGFGRRWPHPSLWSIRGHERGAWLASHGVMTTCLFLVTSILCSSWWLGDLLGDLISSLAEPHGGSLQPCFQGFGGKVLPSGGLVAFAAPL